MAVNSSQFVNIDETGFHRSDFEDVKTFIDDTARSIFGNDINIDPDTQDGIFLDAVVSSPLFDTVLIAEEVYNSFSPSTAMSDALTRNVKLNGIARRSATFSTAEVDLVGTVGTVINDGVVQDTLNQKWNLPESVVIPLSGTITVTATAQNIGEVLADPSTIIKISTPTRGWQTVNNPTAATTGVPVETDFELRFRQTISVSIPARSVFESTQGNVGNQDGVTRFRGYENDTDLTDANGIPPHSISMVVEGGLDQDIVDAIAVIKTPGTGTFGTTSGTNVDKFGVPNIINFFRPTIATIGVEISLTALTGFVTTTEDLIKESVADYISDLMIGEDVFINRLYCPANLENSDISDTYDITLIRIKKDAGAFGTSNIPIVFNEAAFCDAAIDVTLIVT